MNAGEPLSEGHLLDGRYRVKKVLGVGGMGRVYLSNDTRLANRPVAVKEMVIGDGIQEKKAIEDFTREANVLARLSHPGIPTLIDHFAENGRHYLVMEFVAGGDLQTMLDKMGPKARLQEDQVLGWARQMLEVLEFLHSQNPPIIYRDLKPGNIMIGRDGRAMLIDFGIARFLPPGGRGTQIGSIGYAPPEQYLGKVEPRSDLYSLAATMHHLLTGRDPQLEPPFSFPPLRSLAPEVSLRTTDAVTRSLEQDVTKRFASASEMLRALPEPPDTGARSGTIGAASRGLPSPVATMPTVVLSQHQSVPSSSPISSIPPSAPSRAMPSASSSMPTIVLSEPISEPVTSEESAAAKIVGPQLKKALEFGNKARQMIERGINSIRAASTPAAVPSAASTAKTQELKRPSVPQSPAYQRGPGPDRLAPSIPLTAQPKSNGAGAAAKLVARTGAIEFGITGPRTIIGRSKNAAEAVDIDLTKVSTASERVASHHAEIIKRGPDYFIRDLGSIGGTYIAGRGRLGRDQLYKLKDRDQVVLGGAILQFRRG
ncbi:MAG TPA: protein kinase [Candidatus Binataceae bacterium]|nr:protein kinase [Candidatus Binataceae bacterium]